MTSSFPAFSTLFQGLARFRKYLLWVSFALLVYVYLSLFQKALIDDAFITLQYAKTLLRSGTWGFYPGHVTNTATSPLNVLLLAGVALLTGPTETAATVLASMGFFGLAVVLIQLSRKLFQTEIFGYLALAALLFNPLLVSTIGLESILLLTLLVAALYAYVVEKWGRMAILLALVTLTRPEGVLFFLVFWAFTPTYKKKLRVAFLYALACAPWFLYSWIQLGSLLPDTFFIKLGQRSWDQWTYANGLGLYLEMYPWAAVLSFIALPIMLIFLLHRSTRSFRPLSLIGWTALIHFVGYALLSVPPYHWYYTPEVGLAILGSTLGLGVLWSRSTSQTWRQMLLKGGSAFFIALPAIGMASILVSSSTPLSEAPIHTNWATHEQYQEISRWLSENHRGETIAVSGEIGTLAFFCDCYLTDMFSDRHWMDRSMRNLTRGDGLSAMFFRFNFAFYRESASFPLATYTLTGHTSREWESSERPEKVWETSTKWIPQGLLVLAKNSHEPPLRNHTY